jgi:hypothetical protein
MQAMNADQPIYYPTSTGSHPAPNGYYIQNGIETRKFLFICNSLKKFSLEFFIEFSPRNPNAFAPPFRMPQPVRIK